MNAKKGATWCASALAIVAAAANSPRAAHALCTDAQLAAVANNLEPLYLILADKTGSMAEEISDCTALGGVPGSQSRDACAKAFIGHSMVPYLVTPSQGEEFHFFIWEFTDLGAGTLIINDDCDHDYHGPNNIGGNNAAGNGGVLQRVQGVLAAVPFGSTPLADAYCKGFDFVKTHSSSGANAERHILLVTDGDENASLPTGCLGAGDSFALGHPFVDASDNQYSLTCGANLLFNPGTSTPIPACVPAAAFFVTPTALTQASPPDFSSGLLMGSWQANVLDLAISGARHSAPPLSDLAPAFKFPASGQPFIKTDTHFIVDFVPAMFARMATPASVAEPKATGAARSLVAGAAPATVSDDIDFFGGLSRATGGRLTLPVPSSSGDPRGVHTLLGDADDSGCVDGADVALVKQFFGQRASAAQSLAADVSGDGVIDDRDYLLIKHEFGTGCATSPGAIAVLPQVLFGFGDADNWSSRQADSTTTATPKTQGALALEVADSGFVILSSVPFNTEFFRGLVSRSTSALALDVFIPTPPRRRVWLGSVDVFVSCPSALLFNAFLGHAELSNRPTNSYSTLQFRVPAFVRSAMLGSHPDFRISVVLDAPDGGHLLDNLRFR